MFCVQGWECPAVGHLPQERALSKDVLHIHPRVRQECGSTGRAEQEELGVRRCGAGVRGSDACSTCFLCVREGRGLGVNSGFFVYSWSEDVFPDFALQLLCHFSYPPRPVLSVPTWHWSITSWSPFRGFLSISCCSQVRPQQRGHLTLTRVHCEEVKVSLAAVESTTSLQWLIIGLLTPPGAQIIKHTLEFLPCVFNLRYSKVFEVQPKSDLWHNTSFNMSELSAPWA